MKVQTFRPKREKSVQAVQLMPDSVVEAARWCGGRQVEEKDPFDESITRVALNIPTLEGVVRASETDYILQDFEGGFRVLTAAKFEDQYERPTRGQ